MLVRPRKVTAALPFRCNTPTQMVVDIIVMKIVISVLKGLPVNMKTTNSLRARASRFFSDRYAYRAQPNYLSELVAFGVIAATVVWPVLLLAHAMATTLR